MKIEIATNGHTLNSTTLLEMLLEWSRARPEYRISVTHPAPPPSFLPLSVSRLHEGRFVEDSTYLSDFLAYVLSIEGVTKHYLG